MRSLIYTTLLLAAITGTTISAEDKAIVGQPLYPTTGFEIVDGDDQSRKMRVQQQEPNQEIIIDEAPEKPLMEAEPIAVEIKQNPNEQKEVHKRGMYVARAEGDGSGRMPHTCIHDTKEIQRMEHDGFDQVVPQKVIHPKLSEQTHEFRTQSTGTIRVTFSTDDLFDSSKYCASSSGTSDNMQGGTISCSADHVLTSAIRTNLINDILPAAAQRLGEVLSITRVTGNLITGSCGTFTVPSSHTSTGVANSDFVLYVAGAPTSGSTAAWAGTCRTDSNGRPIAGRANFGPKYHNWADASASGRESMIETAVHEVLHALGISGSKFSDKSTISVRGKTGITIVGSPKVKEKTREFYNCNTLDGMELEDEGSSGSAGSHWERRLARDEIMAASSGFALSPITLAALEDSGHYTPDYSKAGQMSFGKDAGCSFHSQKCNTVAGGKDTFFCFTEGGKSCTADFSAAGYCSVSTYTSDLPSYFQYFSDPKKGGSMFMDGCPTVQGYSNRICGDSTSDSPSATYGTYYGTGGKCFESDKLIKSNFNAGSTDGGQRCLQARCPGCGARVEVAVNGVYVSCPSNGAAGTATPPSGYKGDITCPAASDICGSDINTECTPGATTTTAAPATPTPTTGGGGSTPTTTTTAAPTTPAPPDTCDTEYLLDTTKASPSTVLTVEAINLILQEHNKARRNVMPWATTMPMLQWNQDLANFAQQYSDGCPHGNSLQHSTNAQRQNLGGFSQSGENLAAGSGSSYLPPNGGAQSTKAWNDEVKDWKFGVIGQDKNCSNGATSCVVGHYTQNIWADTTHVGCGYKRCDSLPFKNYWSCVYGPAGNFGGRTPYTKTEDATKVATCQITGLGTTSSAPTTTAAGGGGGTPTTTEGPNTPAPGNGGGGTTPPSSTVPVTTRSPNTAAPPTPRPATGGGGGTGATATPTRAPGAPTRPPQVPADTPVPSEDEEERGGIPYVRGRFRLRGTQFAGLVEGQDESKTLRLRLALRRDLSRMLNILMRFIRIDSLKLGSLIVDYTITDPANSVEGTNEAIQNNTQGFHSTQDMYAQETGSTETLEVTETSTEEGTQRGKSVCGNGLAAYDCAVILSTGIIIAVGILALGIVLLVCASRKNADQQERQKLKEPSYQDNPVGYQSSWK